MIIHLEWGVAQKSAFLTNTLNESDIGSPQATPGETLLSCHVLP